MRHAAPRHGGADYLAAILPPNSVFSQRKREKNGLLHRNLHENDIFQLTDPRLQGKFNGCKYYSKTLKNSRVRTQTSAITGV
jgi:hypothetical protein